MFSKVFFIVFDTSGILYTGTYELHARFPIYGYIEFHYRGNLVLNVSNVLRIRWPKMEIFWPINYSFHCY